MSHRFEPYRLSVGIVTRNRPESLKRTLESLSAQSVQPFEVIISDDSDEDHKSSIRLLASQYNCKYISGPKNGLYSNRNHVAKASTGTHFRTMDDDHEFPTNHFEECYKAIAKDPDSIWIIGEYLPSQLNQVQYPHPCPGELHPKGFSKLPEDTQNCYGISCGASIYPRSVIEHRIFNVEYFKFGITYLEYGCRLKRFGYQIRHLAKTYVIHHYEEGNRSFLSKKTLLGARLFSMLSFSFIFYPSSKNKLLFSLECLKEFIKNPALFLSSFSDARKAFFDHNKSVRNYSLLAGASINK